MAAECILQLLEVLPSEEGDAQGSLPVAPSAAEGLPHVGHGEGEAVIDDTPYVCVVNAHPERDSGHDQIEFTRRESRQDLFPKVIKES
jgi:hypothetical protein